ncbi:MAG: hypothetical protein WEA58_01595 [Balneolaceae bacterium]
MKNLHFTTSLLGFILLLGAIFFAQCDTDTRNDQFSQEQEQVPRVDEEDRRYDGTETEGTGSGNQETAQNFEEERDQLAADIEELNNQLSEELSDRANLSEEQAEQIENDQTELSRILREVQTATESNWEDIHSDAQQTYEQVSSRYDQRGNTTMGD